MKTAGKTQDEVNRELIQSTIELLENQIELIRHEIDNEYSYHIDENGFLTKEAHERIVDLQQEEKDIRRNINLLKYQIEFFSSAKNIPGHIPEIEENDFDLINVLDAYAEEARREQALKEIQQIRSHNSLDKSPELTR